MSTVKKINSIPLRQAHSSRMQHVARWVRKDVEHFLDRAPEYRTQTNKRVMDLVAWARTDLDYVETLLWEKKGEEEDGLA